MKQFKEYLKETSGKVVLTFGHFNPPNIENEKLINKVHESAEGGPYRIYTSQECDEHSPLEYNTKVKFMRKIFPRHARSIISDSKIVDLYDALDSLYEQGYTKVDLVMPNIPKELKEEVNNYNRSRYNFKSIDFISVDTHDIEPKIIEAAKDNNFELFVKSLPSTLKEGHKLFNAVRSSLGLKETYNFRQHIQLPTLSKEREAYVNGELFKAGDVVEVKDTKHIGQIQRLGSNYVIIETYDGEKQRKWLKDIIKVEEAVINKMLNEYGWIAKGSVAKSKQPKEKTRLTIKSFKEDLSTFDRK